MDIIQPYITGIIQALLGLLAVVIIAAIFSLRSKVNTWLASKTTSSKAAYTYLSVRLNEYGIKIGESEIRAIIEKSVLEYNAATKSIGTTIVTNVTKGDDSDASKEFK